MSARTQIRALLLKAIPAVFLLGFAGFSLASVPQKTASLSDEVRHQLLMLPYYNVFDELSFAIDGSNTITLTGEVTRPIVKSDAEAAVRNIPGVRQVIDKIDVLPLSRFDNSIRFATYRAIFSRPGFEKYAMQVNSPIRIIVKNGNVTLVGVVDNPMDKQMADMAARSVPGVFSVTDRLKIL